MKFFSVLFLSLLIFLSIGSQELLAVKLKNVSQSGTGKSGIVKIEFNNHYSKSDITVNYSANKVDLIIPNAFVVPVKRIFKGSSAKSSVAKMEAANISGRSLKLSIYFRDVPIDIIKKTAKLTGDGNVVSFNYFTSMEAAAAAPQEQEPSKEEVKAPPLLPVQAVVETKIPEVKAETKNVVTEPVNVEQRTSVISLVKKYLLALARFFKMAILIVLLGLVVFALFYILRKFSNKPYLNEPEQKVFGSTKVQQHEPGIRVVNKLEMEKDKTLYVVEVMGERMLIATGKGYVTMLSRLQNDTKDVQGSLFTETNNEIFHTRLKDKLNGF